jgi:5-methylcytosine-specific restriction endonuclease McrBC GTP-binding regulatory subunit McrB
MYNKNTIFYGPPGTGKTFKSVIRAVAIIEHKNEQDITAEKYSDVKKRYESYIEEGRIIFCTFHQSMGYEDFIEGIKPQFNEDNSNLIYKIEDGIIKIISKNAVYQKFSDGIDTVVHIYDKIGKIVDNYYEYYRDLYQNHENIFKTRSFTTKSGIQNVNRTQYVSPSEFVGSPQDQDQNIVFYQSSKSFVSKKAIKRLLCFYFGRRKLSIKEVQNLNLTNAQGVVANTPENAFIKIMGNSTTTTYYFAIFYDLYLVLKRVLSSYAADKPSNFVLIIDEINRGNISQIFGETITSIEENKRLGQPEEIKVLLTYSKQYFSVPDNVFIIGTMNTADRSVESLDIALRRRFRFEPLYPDWVILYKSNHNITDGNIVINKGLLLQAINKRISYFLDDDHTIGHSWLMNCNSLTDLKIVFYQNIIPLLQEYFYNDYGKIQQILGSKFVKTLGNPIQMLGENNDIPEFTKYQITDSNSWTINDFGNIYEALPNKSLP